MKNLITIIAALLLVIAAYACRQESAGSLSPLAVAEEAFANGRFAKAQRICDTLVIGDSFSRLDAGELCRLSMLLVGLGEFSAEEGANFAMASRSMNAAYLADSDSVMSYIHGLEADDQAVAVMLLALRDASACADSMCLAADADSVAFL